MVNGQWSMVNVRFEAGGAGVPQVQVRGASKEIPVVHTTGGPSR